ncbi:MAG: LysR family transcriptional regulator, partial [Selenomonas sp.]|nr:LysR family transcriptional regulator [Selenomonas sp.]
MEFRQFRYILTVAQEGSISRAAQKLYISQPSLSQSIAGIEKKL